jgi:hypothetical protein
MNKQLKEEISIVQGGMFEQAEKTPLPEGFMAIAKRDCPQVTIMNTKNGKIYDCPLFAYKEVRKALTKLL